MVVLVLLKSGIAQIAPQHSGHAKLMGPYEGVADLNNLFVAVGRSKINRCANRGCAHVKGFLNGAEQDLVELVRVGEQLVMVDLHDERDLVRVLAGDGSENAEG